MVTKRHNIGIQTNTPMARAFRDIVTAGWANQSDGNVESLVGHFALVTFTPQELPELRAAVWTEDDAPSFSLYPGAYVVVEDSDGNTTVTEYLTESGAKHAFSELVDEYNTWLAAIPEDEKQFLYLVCKGCGEAFLHIDTAHQHGTADPNTKTWCGEDGFDILPESEAF